MADTPKIHAAIIAAMRDMPSIAKGRKNQGQGYSFRGIDDVYLAASPVLAKHGIFMSAVILEDRAEERTSKSGGAIMSRTLKIRYSFTAEDGSHVETDAIGEGMDSGDKASAKAMSIAQKYAVLQMFLIPTSDPKDPEDDNHDLKPKTHPAGPEFDAKPKPKDRDPASATMADRYKFALGAHPKINREAAKGIYEDVVMWNGGRKDAGTLRCWELILDCWDAGLVVGPSGVEGVLRGVPSGDVPGLEKVLLDRLEGIGAAGMTEEDVPF